MPIRIVIMPDAWGETLIQKRELLLAWRDDLIQLAVNRELLLRYMRLMHRIGMPESLLRRWGWWFNSSRKCILVRENQTPMTALQLCEFVAHEADANMIVGYTNMRAILPEKEKKWISLQDCLASIEFPRVIKTAG